MPEIIVSTSKKQQVLDITSKVAEVVKKSKVKEGICLVYVKGATAGIIINENWDPHICDDFLDCLDKQVPQGVWRHDSVDGNGAAHIKAAIIGPSETIPITNGELDLGQWQSIMLADFDGPRSDRRIVIKLVSS